MSDNTFDNLSDEITPFLGLWLMDVDACEFDQSDLPRSGSCRIEEEFGLVHIHMSLVDASGEVLNAQMSGVPGGPETRMKESGLVDSMALFFEDARTLVSQAKRDGAVLMSAKRVLSDDGQTLEIEQTVAVPGEGPVSNTAIYRKAQ